MVIYKETHFNLIGINIYEVFTHLFRVWFRLKPPLLKSFGNHPHKCNSKGKTSIFCIQIISFNTNIFIFFLVGKTTHSLSLFLTILLALLSLFVGYNFFLIFLRLYYLTSFTSFLSFTYCIFPYNIFWLFQFYFIIFQRWLGFYVVLLLLWLSKPSYGCCISVCVHAMFMFIFAHTFYRRMKLARVLAFLF